MRAGERLLGAARRRAGISQRELSRRTGVAQATISRIEAGKAAPSADLLDTLVDACGMELAVVERAGAGVDRSQIAERLALTPAERLRLGASAAEAVRRLREAAAGAGAA